MPLLPGPCCAVKLQALAAELVRKVEGARACAIRIDCTDAASVVEAFHSALRLGQIQVMVYNVGIDSVWPPPSFCDIPVMRFEKAVQTQCVGAFICAQQVLRAMVERRQGTIIFTGATASVRGAAGSAELACGKFAVRALSQCLSREFGPKGIHVAHIVLDGVISAVRSKDGISSKAPESVMDSNAIAESFWQVHAQPLSAWTQELDLRPFDSSA